MIKVGVADYGIRVWEGNFFDYLERMARVKKVGYDGLERLQPHSAEHALTLASNVRKMGMDFGTCLAPTAELSLQWTSALGKSYMWAAADGKDFETYCRQVNGQIEYCKPWGVEVGIHNHMGSLVETQEEFVTFLEKCPECKIVLDVGHLEIAEGGDPLYIIENYFDRLAVIHLKEWVSIDPTAEHWNKRGYFCGLGQGNTKVRNDEVVKLLLEKGYDGWIFIEHDTHKQDAYKDLALSREYLRKLGV